MRIFLIFVASVLLVPLGGCGLRPLYAHGNQGTAAKVLAGIEISPIEGQAGWLVQGALRDRLKPTQGSSGDGNRWRLDVRLDDAMAGPSLRQPDEGITGERRTLRARYHLVDAASGKVVLDATAAKDAGIDVTASGYATIAAEATSLERLSEAIADQIIARVAVFANGAAGK